MNRGSRALSASAAAAGAGLPPDVLFAWVRRGHFSPPVCGWREADVRALIAMKCLSLEGISLDACGEIVQRGPLAAALDRGRGFAVLVTAASLSTAGGVHSSGEVLLLDRIEDVLGALAAHLRRPGAARRFIVLDLGEIARRAADGFAMALLTRRGPGRPRREAA